MEQTPQWISLTQASDILGSSEEFVRHLVYMGFIACESGFPYPKMVSYSDTLLMQPVIQAARDLVCAGAAPSVEAILDAARAWRFSYV